MMDVLMIDLCTSGIIKTFGQYHYHLVINLIDIKNRKYWENYFKNRLYIASFILALVGWFILFTYLFGQLYEKNFWH